MCTANNASLSNEMHVSHDSSRDRDAGQTSSADGATGSLPNQSNIACFVTESCAASAEVSSQEEMVNEQSHEHNRFEAEAEEDPSLFLECNSEPEFDIELAEFREVNATSDKNKARPGKPANQAGSSLAKTKNHDSVYKPPYKVSHYCTFCGMLQSAIGLHLVSCHRDQKEVLKLLRLPLQSKERQEQFQRLMAEAQPAGASDWHGNNNVEYAAKKAWLDPMQVLQETGAEKCIVSAPFEL